MYTQIRPPRGDNDKMKWLVVGVIRWADGSHLALNIVLMSLCHEILLKKSWSETVAMINTSHYCYGNTTSTLTQSRTRSPNSVSLLASAKSYLTLITRTCCHITHSWWRLVITALGSIHGALLQDPVPQEHNRTEMKRNAECEEEKPSCLSREFVSVLLFRDTIYHS